MTVPIGSDVSTLNFRMVEMREPDRAQRRDAMLDAATAILREKGYRDTTMLDVARRVSASKETLYAWFGNKSGLFQAVIRRNANTVRTVLDSHLDGNAPVEEALADVGRALATLLLGDGAVAINRAAISEARSEPVLARILIETGREATLPFFVRYLERCRERGSLDFDDPWEAAETFLGLLLGDKQIRRLLGALDAPEVEEIEALAKQAAARFLRLYG